MFVIFHLRSTVNVCYAFHQWNFLLNALWYTGSSIHIDPVEKKDDYCFSYKRLF